MAALPILSTIQTLQYSTDKYSTVQISTVQYSSVQWSTSQQLIPQTAVASRLSPLLSSHCTVVNCKLFSCELQKRKEEEKSVLHCVLYSNYCTVYCTSGWIVQFFLTTVLHTSHTDLVHLFTMNRPANLLAYHWSLVHRDRGMDFRECTLYYTVMYSVERTLHRAVLHSLEITLKQ